ncbi:MAG: STAS domain-containing protein [Spirochaetota bacterium]|nr:STAS domain-containing protein [Spirochaetota bacterium]
MLNIQDMGEGAYVIRIGIPEVHTLDVPDLKDHLQQAIIDKDITKLILDLSDVKVITSSGIGIFLNINKSLKSCFALASPSREVKKVLDLTKVSSVIKVFDTIDDAVTDLSSQ